MRLVTVARATFPRATPREMTMAKTTITESLLLSSRIKERLSRLSIEKLLKKSEESRLRLLKKLKPKRPSNEDITQVIIYSNV
jgi:hypothetical protein